ncbi:oxidoreductase [Enterobacter sp. Ap-916]|uniref:NAD(P)H-dependent oxidoreductase n=1 Tax=Enterobacteriaceae TaxID=543 RepID=UPI0014231B17|nr:MULTISPECIES: NAD(P)H-dependent oxidoreductase [unclassified Enterobacter]NIF60103.1 oxidoreductase [Enterobacter sp. Ap-867]NIG31510.1 oxidoreductase [Enterobacter sp. Ap-916]
MNKILVLAAHRAPEESRINRAGVTALKSIAGVTVHELKREYPDHQIDVEREQALLVEHDAIVLMFPFWWYSSPAILKDWQDQVLTFGFAYGTNGTALHGKKLMVMTSTGGQAEAYRAEGANRYTVEELLLPFHAMANKTGMIWQAPALIQGANTITEVLIDEGVNGWLSRVQALKG